MEDSRIKSVSDLLSSFFDEETAKRGRTYAEFSRSWKAIAGARLGTHSRPVDVRHGILIVECEHQGWMQLLQLQAEKILEEAAARHPDLELRGIAFALAKGKDETTAPGSGRRNEAVKTESRPAEPTQPEALRPDETRLPKDLKDAFSRIRKNLDAD